MFTSADTLYIIGNGFDRVHGLESSYTDFREWLRLHDAGLLSEVEAVWQNDSDMWSDFEQSLGVVNPTYFMSKYGSDRTGRMTINPFDRFMENSTDESNMEKTYQDNADFVLENSMSREHYPSEFHCIGGYLSPLVDRLIRAFNKWVMKLDRDVRHLKPIMQLRKDALFVNFNYTGTLEKLYGVPREMLLYIHGRANSHDTVMFGHNKTSLQIESELEELNNRIGFENIAEYSNWIRFLSKDVDGNICRCHRFFEGMTEVQDIFILGFSFSDIDMDYIYRVVNETASNGPYFYISFYTERDRVRIMDFIHSYGIPDRRCTLLRLEDL